MRWRAELSGLLRESAFARSVDRSPRIGAEVEWLTLDAHTGRVVSVEERLMPFLRAHAREHAWCEEPSAKGAPRFVLPGGGAVTLEPGGQIEYATPPFAAVSELLADLRAFEAPLAAGACAAGILFLGTGIDPWNRLEDAPLQIGSDRYRRMDAYLSGIGHAGARMMRQTASVQVNVDAADPPLAWRMLNAAAPYLTAMFANSPRYGGEATGHASYRAHVWRELDPTRTGVFPCRQDPAVEYADFALAAPVIAQRSARGEYLPLLYWLEHEPASAGLVADHMSTLFPEVRPRGYFEVRSIDALPAALLPAPVLMLAGLVMDAAATAEAAELLGGADPMLLEHAGRVGVRDPGIARTAASLVRIALVGCERLRSCDASDVTVLRDFLRQYTSRGRSPGDDHAARLPAPAAGRPALGRLSPRR